MINVQDVGTATQCDVERALWRRRYRRHDNPECAISTYEDLEGALRYRFHAGRSHIPETSPKSA